MAQPHINQVHVNKPLTNVSIAYMQKAENFIADKVFPPVPVDKQTDIFPVYDQNDLRRDEAMPRAPSTESAGGGYNIDNTNTYYAEVVDYHKDISDLIRANADSGFDMERDAAQFVTQKLLIARERRWATSCFNTGIWGTDLTGVASSPTSSQFIKWSDFASSTPISDIEDAKAQMLIDTGIEPNTLVLGYNVFKALKQHPVITATFRYTSDRGVATAGILANLFDLDNVYIAKASYATNVEDETEANAFALGDNALLCYSNPAPSLMSPSAGYSFGWRGVSDGMGANVSMKSFYMPHIESQRVEGRVAVDHKVVAADLGYFFSAAV